MCPCPFYKQDAFYMFLMCVYIFCVSEKNHLRVVPEQLQNLLENIYQNSKKISPQLGQSFSVISKSPMVDPSVETD